MGLRLTREGVSRSTFRKRFDRQLEEIYGAQIERSYRLGLLEWAGPEGDVLRLTRGGRMLGNQVFVDFI
jgi:coproporphyrinogen III oxidase-like Fe-S oxidoreductase